MPLLISALVSYGFVVLTLPRSILTEKLSRRGYHLSREYIVDPMEGLAVDEVMRSYLGQPYNAETLKLDKNVGDGKFRDVTKEVGLGRVTAGAAAEVSAALVRCQPGNGEMIDDGEGGVAVGR